MTGAKNVVMSYQKALGKADWAGARRHLVDNLAFKGPFESFNHADSYLESIKKLHNIVERVDMKKVFEDGDDVCLLYDMVTKTPAGTAFIMEWHRVKDDKIHAITVLFDPRPFAPMFGK